MNYITHSLYEAQYVLTALFEKMEREGRDEKEVQTIKNLAWRVFQAKQYFKEDITE